MVEPENREIAFVLAGVTTGMGKVAIDRRTVVPRVAVLDLETAGVADQDVIEFSVLDLVGVGHRFVSRLGEMEDLGAVVVGRHEFGCPFFHAHRRHFVGPAEPLEQGQAAASSDSPM